MVSREKERESVCVCVCGCMCVCGWVCLGVRVGCMFKFGAGHVLGAT